MVKFKNASVYILAILITLTSCLWMLVNSAGADTINLKPYHAEKILETNKNLQPKSNPQLPTNLKDSLITKDADIDYDSTTNTLTLHANNDAKPTYVDDQAQWEWSSYLSTVQHIVIDGAIQVSDGTKMFADMPELLDITGLDKVNVDENAKFTQMFANDSKINTISLLQWDMTAATDTADMFSGDKSLWKVTFSNTVRFPNDPDLPISPADKSEIPDGTGFSVTKQDATDWQDVGEGNEDYYNPNGEILAADANGNSGLYNRYKMGQEEYPLNDKTYVWQQDWWTVTQDSQTSGKVLKLYPHIITNNISEIDTGKTALTKWPWNNDRNDITRIEVKEGVKFAPNSSAKAMFAQMPNLQIASVHRMSVVNCTSFALMFANDTSLTSLTGLADWQTNGNNTSSVNDLANMFNGCTNLKIISGISNWDVSNVTSTVNGMLNMFANCTQLQSLDLSGWNMSASAVPNTGWMFRSDSNLWNLTLGPSVYFSTSPKIPAAPGKNKPFPDNSGAISLDNYWRQVASGGIHNPQGDLFTSETLFDNYKSGNAQHPTAVQTYVWNTKGDYLNLEVTPDNIDFGTYKIPVGDIHNTTPYALNVNDKRPDRDGVAWSVKASISQLTSDDGSSTLPAGVWYNTSDVPSTEAIFNGESNLSSTKYLVTDKFPFYLHFTPQLQPNLGHYSATVTYTLNNDFSTAIDPDDTVGSDNQNWFE